jgi:Zn-dependent protease
MARLRGYGVWSVEIYPIHGVTRCDAPRSHFDRCLVAWGGVLAQIAIAIPLIAWVAIFGYTSVEAINAVLALLGFFSLAIAAINLLPIPHLDGSLAWQLLPLLLRRLRSVQNRRADWRSLP